MPLIRLISVVLPGAVGPDQPENLAALQREADVVDRDQAVKAPGEVADFEDGIHVIGGAPGCFPENSASRAARNRRTISARPRGMNTTATTMTTPKNRPARLVISLDRNSETAESESAPTTGPRTVPGPPNTAMMIILTFRAISNALSGSRR